ncbi:hypothetical protein ASB57_11170 [Bordetella sp. N]|nr:hypothetical protein ASB57_11170 [Bordetella sp. N]
MNLLVPVAGPMLLLGLITPVRGPGVAKRLIKASVSDGQLYWSAIALSAAAIYEAIDAFHEERGNPLYIGLLISGFVLIALIASIIVMLATVESYDQKATDSTGSVALGRDDRTVAESNIVKMSYWLTLLIVVSSGLQHIYISVFPRATPQDEAATLGSNARS